MRQRWMIVHKVVLKTVLPVIRMLPHRLAHAWLGTMGRLDLLVIPQQEQRYCEAVAQAAKRMRTEWPIRETALELARQTYRWRVRDLMFDSTPPERLDRWFQVSGREHLDQAVARGRGVILLANHFGSHVVTSHWMFKHGYDLRWFSEKPRNVSGYLLNKLQGDGPLGQSRMFISRRQSAAEAASSILRTARGLSSGLIVKIACDVRWNGSHTSRAWFLGKEASYSKTWVMLAATTGAAVVPVFCQSDESGRYRLDFEPWYVVPSEAASGSQADWWVQNALDSVEERVRAHPAQSNDYFFWTDDELEADTRAA
jgi:KDO2-lipid IV(A) lauroyltransferase